MKSIFSLHKLVILPIMYCADIKLTFLENEQQITPNSCAYMETEYGSIERPNTYNADGMYLSNMQSAQLGNITYTSIANAHTRTPNENKTLCSDIASHMGQSPCISVFGAEESNTSHNTAASFFGTVLSGLNVSNGDNFANMDFRLPTLNISAYGDIHNIQYLNSMDRQVTPSYNPLYHDLQQTSTHTNVGYGEAEFTNASMLADMRFNNGNCLHSNYQAKPITHSYVDYTGFAEIEEFLRLDTESSKESAVIHADSNSPINKHYYFATPPADSAANTLHTSGNEICVSREIDSCLGHIMNATHPTGTIIYTEGSQTSMENIKNLPSHSNAIYNKCCNVAKCKQISEIYKNYNMDYIVNPDGKVGMSYNKADGIIYMERDSTICNIFQSAFYSEIETADGHIKRIKVALPRKPKMEFKFIILNNSYSRLIHSDTTFNSIDIDIKTTKYPVQINVICTDVFKIMSSWETNNKIRFDMYGCIDESWLTQKIICNQENAELPLNFDTFLIKRSDMLSCVYKISYKLNILLPCFITFKEYFSKIYTYEMICSLYDLQARNTILDMHLRAFKALKLISETIHFNITSLSNEPKDIDPTVIFVHIFATKKYKILQEKICSLFENFLMSLKLNFRAEILCGLLQNYHEIPTESRVNAGNQYYMLLSSFLFTVDDEELVKLFTCNIKRRGQPLPITDMYVHDIDTEYHRLYNFMHKPTIMYAIFMTNTRLGILLKALRVYNKRIQIMTPSTPNLYSVNMQLICAGEIKTTLYRKPIIVYMHGDLYRLEFTISDISKILFGEFVNRFSKYLQ